MFGWIRATALYRERDYIKQDFRDLVYEPDVLPLNTHSDDTTKGYLFIAFLSLILRSKLLKMMKDSGMLKKYSVERVVLELEKCQKGTLADGRVMTTEMTKKQRTFWGR